MDCKREENLKNCNCSYTCERKGSAEGLLSKHFCESKGLCCECVKHHRENGELPACYFDNENEKTYDRSIEHYCKINKII
jgi:hypothetical protein